MAKKGGINYNGKIRWFEYGLLKFILLIWFIINILIIFGIILSFSTNGFLIIGPHILYFVIFVISTIGFVLFTQLKFGISNEIISVKFKFHTKIYKWTEIESIKIISIGRSIYDISIRLKNKKHFSYLIPKQIIPEIKNNAQCNIVDTHINS